MIELISCVCARRGSGTRGAPTWRGRIAGLHGMDSMRSSSTTHARAHARTRARPPPPHTHTHIRQRGTHPLTCSSGPRRARRPRPAPLRGQPPTPASAAPRPPPKTLRRGRPRTTRVGARHKIPNTKYTCDTGQTRNKLLEQWEQTHTHTKLKQTKTTKTVPLSRAKQNKSPRPHPSQNQSATQGSHRRIAPRAAHSDAAKSHRHAALWKARARARSGTDWRAPTRTHAPARRPGATHDSK